MQILLRDNNRCRSCGRAFHQIPMSNCMFIM